MAYTSRVFLLIIMGVVLYALPTVLRLDSDGEKIERLLGLLLAEASLTAFWGAVQIYYNEAKQRKGKRNPETFYGILFIVRFFSILLMVAIVISTIGSIMEIFG